MAKQGEGNNGKSRRLGGGGNNGKSPSPNMVNLGGRNIGKSRHLGGGGSIGKSRNGKSSLPNHIQMFPPDLLKCIRGTESQNMALRGCNNNLWHLKIEKHGDDWYFTKGWIKFIKDNRVRGGDVIMYAFSSEGVLDFKILRAADEVVEEEEDKMIKEEYTDDDWYEYDDHQKVVDEPESRGVVRKRKRKNIDYYSTELFDSGLVAQPMNPYFVTRLRGLRTNELYVPVDVIKCHDIQLTDSVVLVDARGRQFKSRRRNWKDGRTIYVGGWKSICRVNSARKDDRIVCEFLNASSQEGELKLSVSFVRAQQAGNNHCLGK